MPSQIDKKQEIENALMSFSCPSSASDLLRVLGYQSPKTLKLSDQTAQTFLAAFNQAGTLKKDKALVDDWASIDILFQITDEEVRDRLGQVQLFNNTQADKTNIRSFLFFSLCLKAQAYTRTQLATITREINKLFMMPVIIFFTYQQKLSIGIITRRINRRDANKDVLEKVTLIKDINLASPHRAHVEILYDLSLPTLAGKYPLTNFADLQSAWQKTLDVEELNKKFYRELQSWYFWSLLHVTFPEANGSTSPDSPNASNIIRLITRLIFSWFLKEKGLIPEDLFNEHKLQHILNYQDPNNSTYYKAILQNLFFATLNQEMNSPGKEPKRKFRRLNGHAGGLNSNRLVTNLYRYQRYFKDPAAALELFEGIPFLNGGLFECLDHELEENNQKKVVRIDGFSDENGNVLRVPDELFFGEEQVVDLSSFFEEKNKRTPVKGIIRILESYKFTVEENTPINEEVALDPELLGKVFENLLAAYNPETSTTARKSTGSYYTPRAIVDYMVDEALIAFFTNYLKEHEGSHQSEAAAHPSAAPKTASASPLDSQGKSTLEACVRALLSYSDAEHGFTELETRLLVEAIDQVNVLDPACGSGAFPMGVLHKLVHVLGRLDPDNQLWQEVQLDKAVRETEEAYRIGNQEEREHRKKDIEEAFDNNTSDYGRKLYLIESCLYGVDIQPIAVQISKLRFFISLVVDQKTDRTKENLGIRPLPNLETKFVAANSLIGLQKPDQQSPTWMDFGLSAKEAELAEIRHKLFSARTVETKRKYRAQDKATRLEIRDLLLKKGWDNANASKLADWDPYNQNSSAPFFDPEWMMGNRTGFDIVIGNPPYIQLQSNGGELGKLYADKGYQTFTKMGDIYCLFYELGHNLLRQGGHLCFITSNKWMRAGYGFQLRAFFAEKTNPVLLIDFAGKKLFETVTVDNNILLYKKSPNAKACRTLAVGEEFDHRSGLTEYLEANLVVKSDFVSADTWVISSGIEDQIRQKIEALGTPLGEWDVKIYRGVLTGYNDAFIIDGKTKDALIRQDPKSAEILKPILRGRDIKCYQAEFADLWLIATFPALNLDINHFPAVRDYLRTFGKRLHQIGEEYIDEHGIKQKTRKATGNKWFETQDQIAYYEEFEKGKIIYPNMTKYLPFYLDTKGYYTNQKCFILTGESLAFLTAFMNSQLFKFVYRENFPQLLGGTRELSKIFFDKLIIPNIDTSTEVIFKKLILNIQARVSSGSEITKEDEIINNTLYDICGLNSREREAVNKYTL